MTEYKLIKDFIDYFQASEVDEAHVYDDELKMGPFKPLIVHIQGKPVGCVDLRKPANTVDGFVELAYIHMYTAQKGNGSVILQKICELADNYCLEVELDAVPLSKFYEPMSVAKLHSFYRGFGFKNSEVRGSNMMTRYPN